MGRILARLRSDAAIAPLKIAMRLDDKRILPEASKRIRHQLGSQLNMRTKAVVKYGPFQGAQLSAIHWGRDRASMLLGLYESEIVAVVQDPFPFQNFVNVGAGDGFYVAGVASNFGPQLRRVVAFESNYLGHKTLEKVARANGFSGELSVHAACSEAALLELSAEVGANTLFVIDCESCELHSVTSAVLSAFHGARWVVEIHHWITGSDEWLSRTEAWASLNGYVSYRTGQGERNPNVFTELSGLSDDVRWALCSEGRPSAMEWLILQPEQE